MFIITFAKYNVNNKQVNLYEVIHDTGKKTSK